MPSDSFVFADSFVFDSPYGVAHAAAQVTPLYLLLSDTGNHFPNDPLLPPNPVFEAPTAGPVVGALGFLTEGPSDFLIV